MSSYFETVPKAWGVMANQPEPPHPISANLSQVVIPAKAGIQVRLPYNPNPANFDLLFAFPD